MQEQDKGRRRENNGGDREREWLRLVVHKYKKTKSEEDKQDKL